jgi:uracil-DNA glycosylase
MTTDPLEAFVEQLANVSTPYAYNQYAHGNSYNAIRRHNFLLYLRQMHDRAPQTIMVMEAPGYRGCRLTGVPVTSRKLLLNGIEPLGLFGAARGYQDVPEPGFERVQSEQSATIVWQTLLEAGFTPLIWNAFPFHPHLPGEALTNRKPRRDEVQIGRTFLQEMLNLFQPTRVIAVGNVAHETLTTMNIASVKVRHPAQGGKNDFVGGIQALGL